MTSMAFLVFTRRKKFGRIYIEVIVLLSKVKGKKEPVTSSEIQTSNHFFDVSLLAAQFSVYYKNAVETL